MTSQHDCMLKYVHIMSFERNKAKKKKWDSVLDYLPNALIKFVRFLLFFFYVYLPEVNLNQYSIRISY